MTTDLHFNRAVDETLTAYTAMRAARRHMRSYASTNGAAIGVLDKHLTDLCEAIDAMHSAMIAGAKAAIGA